VSDAVNLETDLLAKYVARFLEAGLAHGAAPP
jgi:riboflavin synthase alpha subunit